MNDLRVTIQGRPLNHLLYHFVLTYSNWEWAAVCLMNHYGLSMEKTNPRQARENGDVESLHRHLKKAIDQALMLRGSRDFESRDVYEAFLHEILKQKNAGRRRRLNEELEQLHSLPARRLESFKRVRVGVSQGSLIRVQRNIYSVHSRLNGEEVEVRV